MRGALDEIAEREREQRAAVLLVWLGQISRHYRLGQSPREVARRPWWDVLLMRLAMEVEDERESQGWDRVAAMTGEDADVG